MFSTGCSVSSRLEWERTPPQNRRREPEDKIQTRVNQYWERVTSDKSPYSGEYHNRRKIIHSSKLTTTWPKGDRHIHAVDFPQTKSLPREQFNRFERRPGEASVFVTDTKRKIKKSLWLSKSSKVADMRRGQKNTVRRSSRGWLDLCMRVLSSFTKQTNKHESNSDRNWKLAPFHAFREIFWKVTAQASLSFEYTGK